MLKQVNGRWALVSKNTQRPLAYYKGEGKPSDEWVAKHERRIMDFPQFLKRINYQTHDDTLQKGHGQNLTGKG